MTFCPTSSEYLEDNGGNYLRVVALHEMGNLQFYNENTRSVCVCVCTEDLQPFAYLYNKSYCRNFTIFLI